MPSIKLNRFDGERDGQTDRQTPSTVNTALITHSIARIGNNSGLLWRCISGHE